MHSTKYRTHWECARHGGFQILDVEHRTDSRRPPDQPPSTTTETDEDGDRRIRRLAKTHTDEGEDNRRRRQTHSRDERSGSSLQLTTPQSDEDGTGYFSHATRWLPSPWRMQQSLQPQVHAWNSPSPRSWTCFQENEWLRSVYSPLRLCKLVSQKNYKTFGTTA